MSHQEGSSDSQHQEGQERADEENFEISGEEGAAEENNFRGETTWPSDCITVDGVNAEGMPTDKKTRTRLKRVCGLTGRQKVNINLPNWSCFKKEQREQLFDLNIKPYVAFP